MQEVHDIFEMFLEEVKGEVLRSAPEVANDNFFRISEIK